MNVYEKINTIKIDVVWCLLNHYKPSTRHGFAVNLGQFVRRTNSLDPRF